MPIIEFEVTQQRIAQDQRAEVPQEIIDKGEEDIVIYLWNSGAVDNALDFATGKCQVKTLPID